MKFNVWIPRLKLRGRHRKFLHKTVFPAALKPKLSPYHSKPPLNGLRKIYKPDIPHRPIVSYSDSPCYALADFLHKTLIPLVGKLIPL
jgi:hypothetical protein